MFEYYEVYADDLKNFESMIKSKDHKQRRDAVFELSLFCHKVDDSKIHKDIGTTQANKLLKRAFNDMIGLLGDKDPSVRGEVCRCLGSFKVGGWDSFPYLERMLKDKEFTVRSNAATALGSLGDKRSFKPLIKTIIYDENAYVKSSAIRALGELGDKRALQPLLSIVKGSMLYVANPGRHLDDALLALGELRDARAIDPIIKMLDHKTDYIRITAADALINFPHSEKIETAILNAAIKYKNKDLMRNYKEYQAKKTEIEKRIKLSALKGVKRLPAADRGWAERTIRGLSGGVKPIAISRKTPKIEKVPKPEKRLAA